jgi:LuxR family transcriptional regulator, maltose regulon positive regulatory protein
VLTEPRSSRGELAAGAPKAARAFELLESKLRPPHARGGSVPRAKLVDRLERSHQTPIIVLSGGPGWGKTTLLTEWASVSRRPFAWVSVDERDNDPIVLLTYIAVALDRIEPLDPSVFDALGSPGVSVEATVVPRLGAALATLEQPHVLVLDDLHLLRHTPCLDAIAVLTRHVPKGSQMALSARGGPPLPLGALRTQRLATEIGPDDLRMTETEAGQLLSAAGVDLPADDVAQLTEQTEGWAAALYLAALSIRTRGGHGGVSATFSGRDRLMSDYLRSEFLAHLSRDEFRFLTRTAVLDRLSGPLCDALREESGSAARLESLARSNMFLIPLDAHGSWYRYHHLFGELLRSELERAEPDLVPQLFARASAWCEANGQPEDAIGYAQQAGDTDRTARLVELQTMPAYQSGRAATVEHWLEWLQERRGLEQHAAVAVLAALEAAAQGRPLESDRWAAQAERSTQAGILPDSSESIDSWLAVLRALRCRRGVASMRADAEIAIETLARGSAFRPTAVLLLGISRLLGGETNQADDALTDVAEEGLELGAPESVAVALGERAAIAIERGEWVRADELVDQALAVIRRARLDAYPISTLAYALGARTALRLGRAPRAHALLARAQSLRPRLTYALPHLAVQTRLVLAHAYLAMADAGGARTMLREIDMLFRRQPGLGTFPDEAEKLRASLKSMRAESPGASTLTAAELRLLPYLSTQLTFREIGERLSISHHTVKSHAMAIYRKLSVASRSDAVERMRALGLL